MTRIVSECDRTRGAVQRLAALTFVTAIVTTWALAPAQAQQAKPGFPQPQGKPAQPTSGGDKPKTAIFAGGCFWSVEKDFELCPGVVDVVSGYTGGTTRNPSYKTYAAGKHREAVLVTYDPTKVTFAGLVEFLIKHIDPVDKRGSFIDRGAQYSPAIYYETDEEKEAAQRVIRAINAMKVYKGLITVAVQPRADFFRAEEYHQDFHSKNELTYGTYRSRCGRDPFVLSVWGNRINELILPGAYPWQEVPPEPETPTPPGKNKAKAK